MNATAWAAVAACASAVSAGASLVSIWFTRRAVDFSNCLETVRQLADAQRKVRDAPDAHRDFEFRELFNLMEALALLVNRRKVAPSTLHIVEDFLEQAWAWLRNDPVMSKLMNDAITGTHTYVELVKFAQRRKARIEALTKHYMDNAAAL